MVQNQLQNFWCMVMVVLKEYCFFLIRIQRPECQFFSANFHECFDNLIKMGKTEREIKVNPSFTLFSFSDY